MEEVKQDVQEPKAVDNRESIRQLCNETLYLLQRGYFVGEDAHRVEAVKSFMKSLKDEMTNSLRADAKAADAKPGCEVVSEG